MHGTVNIKLLTCCISLDNYYYRSAMHGTVNIKLLTCCISLDNYYYRSAMHGTVNIRLLTCCISLDNYYYRSAMHGTINIKLLTWFTLRQNLGDKRHNWTPMLVAAFKSGKTFELFNTASDPSYHVYKQTGDISLYFFGLRASSIFAVPFTSERT